MRRASRLCRSPLSPRDKRLLEEREYARQAARWVDTVVGEEGRIRLLTDSVDNPRFDREAAKHHLLHPSGYTDPFATLVPLYSPPCYAYGMFGMVDLAYRALLAGVVDTPDGVRGLAHILRSPLLMGSPRDMTRELGEERAAVLVEMLRWMMGDFDDMGSPVLRAVREAQVESSWVGFIRTLASQGLYRPHVVVGMPTFIQRIVEGRAAQTLPGEDGRDRAGTLATLLAAGAEEYGSTPLIETAMELRKQHSIPNSFAFMLQVQAALQRSAQRAMDWNARTSGDAGAIIGRLLKSYLPLVHGQQLKIRKEIESKKKCDAVDKIPNDPDVNTTQSLQSVTGYFKARNYGATAKRLQEAIIRGAISNAALEKEGTANFFPAPSPGEPDSDEEGTEEEQRDENPDDDEDTFGGRIPRRAFLSKTRRRIMRPTLRHSSNSKAFVSMAHSARQLSSTNRKGLWKPEA